jgi:hypothetical protein
VRDALIRVAIATALLCAAALYARADTDSLPSWRDGKPKQAIVAFVERVTTAGSPDFVAPDARIAVFAFGNSDGDREMLEWTAAGEGARFAGIVHHTDAEREWAYDRESHIGKLDKAWDEAKAKGWTVVDMKAEWKVVYPDAKP